MEFIAWTSAQLLSYQEVHYEKSLFLIYWIAIYYPRYYIPYSKAVASKIKPMGWIQPTGLFLGPEIWWQDLLWQLWEPQQSTLLLPILQPNFQPWGKPKRVRYGVQSHITQPTYFWGQKFGWRNSGSHGSRKQKIIINTANAKFPALVDQTLDPACGQAPHCRHGLQTEIR